MLYEVFGLLLFFGDRFLLSKLPSRELLALENCDSGSANMTEAMLRVGDGGPVVNEGSWENMARVGRFLGCALAAPSGRDSFASRASFESLVAAKGLSMPMRFVGSEGTQRDCIVAGGCGVVVAAAIVVWKFASLRKQATTVKTGHDIG